MKPPRRYAPMGGSLAPVRVAGFRWNGWQPSAVYAKTRKVFVFQLIAIQISAVVMLENDIAVTVPTHYFGKLHVNQNSGPNCITQQI